MVIESLTVSLASVVAELAVVEGVRTFIDRQKQTLNRVAKTTSDAFEAFEGVEIALRKWASSEAFADVIERLVNGERDISDEVIDSFIRDGGFYLADDEEQSSAATQIVSFFLSVLLNELYKGDSGVPLLANRLEEVNVNINTQFDNLATTLGTKLSALTNAVLVPEDPPSSVDLPGSNHSDLVAKIDYARNLLDTGLVRSARSQLQQVENDIGFLPDELKFRVKTNLAGCALAEDDVESACDLLEEAYKIDPGNPTAIANAAVAAHLRDDPRRAISLANEVIEIDPENSQATTALIGALWDMGRVNEIEDLAKNREWVVRDQRCGQVLIGIRMQQSRFEDAISLGRSLVDSFPEDADAHLTLSQCLFHAAETERHNTGYSDALMARFSEVVTITDRAIELLKDTQITLRRNTALVVRGSARAIIGDSDDAIHDFDEVLAEEPTHADATYFKGLCLLGAGRPMEAQNVFEQIDDLERRDESLLPFAVACLEAGDAKAAFRKLQGTLALDCPTWDDVRRAEILRRAAKEAEMEDPLDDLLERGLLRNPNDPKLLTLSFLGRSASSDVEESDDIIRKALEFASDSDRRAIPEFLAHHFQRLGRFSDAADQLAAVVNGVASHPSAISFLICLVKSSRIRDALDWIREIRAADFPTPRIVMDAEVDLLQEAGDVVKAVARLGEICSRSDASSFDQVRLAVAQFRCGKQNDARETINSIKTSDLQDEPPYILLVAQLKHQLDVPGYLDDAYLARQVGANLPDVHLGYFAMFQGQEKEWEEPSIVGPGCAVLLKRGTTEQWWHIQEETEEFGFPGYLAIDEELARSLIGTRTGDAVVLKQGLENLCYEIASIQSKYVRAFQETFEEFTTRFPGHPGLFRISFENDDFSKLFQTVDHQNELSRQTTAMYEDGKLPLATFARFLGRSEVDVWLACTRSGIAKMRFGSGTADIGVQVDRLRQADCIVLDLVSLLTMRELELSEYAQIRFPRVAVPQLVIDEIQKQYSLTVAQQGPAGWLGKSSEGQYVFTDASDQGWVERRGYLRSILRFAESFDRIPSYPLLDVAERSKLIDVIASHGAGAIFAGDETEEGCVVVSDDLGLSELAQSYEIETVNTQAVLWELLRSDTITEEFYSLSVERLASMNYWFVRVHSDDIVHSLEANSFMTSDGTRAMLNTLEGPDCSEESAVSVAANLMAFLAVNAPFEQAELILSAVIAALRRGRDGDDALRAFRAKYRRDYTSYHFEGINSCG